MALGMPYRSVQHVYFDDLDALQILHNVRHLLFMERARGELFNVLGFRWEDDFSVNPDKYHVVAEHQVKFLKAVRGEGDVAVVIQPTHLGNSSLILHATVQSLDGKFLYSDATTRIVRLDPHTDKPCPWSQPFRDKVGPLVRK